MPSEQVMILQLWDEIGLPHENSKQISGPVILCIGFEVDLNLMTVTMIPGKRELLLEACQLFITPRRQSLWDFQRLAGHINWALNVYPKMRVTCPLCLIRKNHRQIAHLHQHTHKQRRLSGARMVH